VQIPWTDPIHESTVRTSQRISVPDEKVTMCLCRQEYTSKTLLSSCGKQRQSFPTPNVTRRVSVQLTRTTRSPATVRGPTRPSTPPSPHWCEEVYPKAESPKSIYFFLFHVICPILVTCDLSDSPPVSIPSVSKMSVPVLSQKFVCYIFYSSISIGDDLRKC
jgi:hypothetical protein